MNERCLNRNGLALLVLAGFLAVAPASAHSPVLDSRVEDWCLGVFPNTYEGEGRVEDSAATLFCGRCSSGGLACLDDSDCFGGETCIDPGSKIETVWWDNRTDAAVNDLATIATTQDETSLYFALQQWGSPDPVSLPFFEIGIDFEPGGIGAWHDPHGNLTTAGTCSNDTSRACTDQFDCHFCAISTEGFASTRRRTCGSDNPYAAGSGLCSDDPGDICLIPPDASCDGVGTTNITAVGLNSDPAIEPDYLLALDLGRYLIGFSDSIQLMKAVGGTWSPVASFGLPANPGAFGDPLFATLEFEIPWSAFGCVGCPLVCDCPDFGPGQEFRFIGMTARGILTLDYTPGGPIEDVFSEALAGTTTATTNSCPGFGTTTTACELADQSQDAFVPAGSPPPGGRIDGLVLAKDVEDSVRLSWSPSCSGADIDYQVYAGLIGDFSSHLPLPDLCTTGGATTSAVPATAGNAYYLIVPTDGSTEGSYGEDGHGSERPFSAAPCRPQSLGDCPIPDDPGILLSHFGQVRLILDEVSELFSDWGSLDLTFVGSDQIEYFNLVVDGEWRVRNLPILSTEGDGVVQTQTVNFRILPDGVMPGYIASVEQVATLTPTPESTAPTLPEVTAFSSRRFVTMESGEEGESLELTTARNVVGGTATEWASNGPVPNQEVGAGECVPGAISNSLHFLDETHGLDIPDATISIDAMKLATGWTPAGAPLSPTPWWDLKKAALDADLTIAVATTTTQEFDQAMAALEADCDVELRAPGHAAVVRGLIKLVGGNRAIVIQHDTYQRWPGGTKREIVIYDATDGTLAFGWGFDGRIFDRFVIECPE